MVAVWSFGYRPTFTMHWYIFRLDSCDRSLSMDSLVILSLNASTSAWEFNSTPPSRRSLEYFSDTSSEMSLNSISMYMYCSTSCFVRSSRTLLKNLSYGVSTVAVSIACSFQRAYCLFLSLIIHKPLNLSSPQAERV